MERRINTDGADIDSYFIHLRDSGLRLGRDDKNFNVTCTHTDEVSTIRLIYKNQEQIIRLYKIKINGLLIANKLTSESIKA